MQAEKKSSQEYDINAAPAFTDDQETFAEASEGKTFVGSKIAIDKLLNKKITFCDFKVSPSQFRRFGDEVTMVQIVVDEEKHVFFTQSKYVTNMLQKFKDKLPRTGTLYKDDRAIKIK